MIRLFSIATLLLALVALGAPNLSRGVGIGVGTLVAVAGGVDMVTDAPAMARPGHCKSLGGKRVLPCHPDLGVMAAQISAIAPASRSSSWFDAVPALPSVAPEAELPPPRLT
ncbi:hypothetical protein [Devosia sp. Root635]|uniref:hypothetical protein n=1 Tax=Devosia sp. Root635 TaxID=1736575 RepID=UPI0006F48FD6|nr:hypothetical protein [Devosia sp. Root635]KRA44891.1 hypothetical protein ASD80_07085 [Devosia sp. Root635]